MKLAELGLKTKPATKCFAFGYVRFSTSQKNLSYEIILFDNKKNQFTYGGGAVIDKTHLSKLLNIKHRDDVTNGSYGVIII